MNETFEIREISASETWPLRHKILRPNGTLKDCQNPEDHLATTFHFGAFIGIELIGVASFHQETCKLLPARNPYRLRGMATDSRYHKQGVGRQVLETSMTKLRNLNCDFLWCNARQNAFAFYERLGFSTVEPLFEISGVGPHKVMYKYLP